MEKKPMGIMERPLDFYVAFLVFVIGLYGLIDVDWPPTVLDQWVAVVLIFEDIYLVLAATGIMIAMACRKTRHVVCSIVVEMFGWLFVSVAAAMIALSSYWIPPAVFVDPHPEDGPHLILWTWIAIWAGLAIATFVRYMDMRRWWMRGGRGE